MKARHIFLAASAMAALAAPAQADTLRDALIAAYESNPTLTGARAAVRKILISHDVAGFSTEC